MSRPKKTAMEGIAAVLRKAMEPEGDLIKRAADLPENEQAHYMEAVWGIIRSIDGRAERLPNTPIGGTKSGA